MRVVLNDLKKFREKEFNDYIFMQMLNLEIYLKEKYKNIDYVILYFNFVEHEIPPDSNIINITVHTKKVYDEINNKATIEYSKFRQYCGKILCTMFKTKFNTVPLYFNN
jgi:hypothetical protein